MRGVSDEDGVGGEVGVEWRDGWVGVVVDFFCYVIVGLLS